MQPFPPPIPPSGPLPPACARCPLAEKHHPAPFPFVAASGPLDARVVAILERPGGEEGRTGIPAVGPTGGELDRGLGGTRNLTYVTNVRKCCPDGEETEEERAASIKHCTAAYLDKEMAALTNARSVLLVGADALGARIGARSYTWTNADGRKIHEPGILQYSGSVFTAAEANGMREILTGEGGWKLPPMAHTVVVTLHPAFALRGQPRYRDEIRTNIMRAVAAGNGPEPMPREERQMIIFDPLPEEVGAAWPTVIDIETPDDEPSKIELCCVTAGPSTVRVFTWGPSYAEAVGRILRSPVVKIGHNFSYDVSAFLDNGLEVAYPLVDTIIAAARIWPPIAQKKLAETAKEKIPVKWLGLDRVALRLLPDIVYWKRPETKATQAFYTVAFPRVNRFQFRKLYNGLDGIYNHRAWLAMRELLQQKKLMDRFQKIDMPAFMPMVRMERRGLLVDEAERAKQRLECEQVQVEAEAAIASIAQSYHRNRVAAVEAGIKELETSYAVLGCMGAAHCKTHPEYIGRTKRTKNPCCVAIAAENASVLADLKRLKGQIRAGKAKLAQIGEEFDPAKPDHWRWLLFDPAGLNSERAKADWIKPVSFTKKQKLPQIDDHTMEQLQRKHPDIPLFRMKIDATYAAWRLANTLAVEVDADGYAHTKLSISRTSTARYSSGTDREDPSKVRTAAAGNQQNIPDKDRRIYVAPPGYKLLSPDYSQIEARVTAWRARCYTLLDAWKRGEDIHTMNAVALAKAIGVTLHPDEARTTPFPYDPQGKSYRDVGKVQTHAMDYGEGPRKMAKLTGMPFAICERIHAWYFEMYPELAERMRRVEQEALNTKYLRNAFGLILGPFEKEKRNGVWTLTDREEALASQPQSDVGDMMKIVSAELDKLGDGAILSMRTTMHDNFWFYAKNGQVTESAVRIKAMMERPWPELGELPGYGTFRCPVEISIGLNGGEKVDDNPNGLEKVKL